APAVRLVDRGTLEEADHVCGRITLAPEWAKHVDFRDEARPRALQRLERERAGNVRGLGETARADETEGAVRGHELRPVDQRQSLFRLELHGCEADGSERIGAFHSL